MSEKGNCGIRDFSKYDEMATEKLEEIVSDWISPRRRRKQSF